MAQDAKAYDANLGWFPFPSVDGGKGDASDALGGGDGFAIGKNAPPAAIDFIRFLDQRREPDGYDQGRIVGRCWW